MSPEDIFNKFRHQIVVDALRGQLALPPSGLRPNFALAIALADASPEVM
jgi:hypothetical protein